MGSRHIVGNLLMIAAGLQYLIDSSAPQLECPVHHGKQVIRQLGIGLEIRRGFKAYPVGGQRAAVIEVTGYGQLHGPE